MEETIRKLYEERLKRWVTTTANRQPDRIPVGSLVTSWAYYYAGKKPRDYFNDPELHKNIVRKTFTDFYWDSVLGSTRPGKMFPQSAIDILDGGVYEYNSEGISQTKPHATTIMEREEYVELIRDPYAFILDKVLPRRYGLFRREDEQKYNDLRVAMQDINIAFERNKQEDDIAKEEFGIVQNRAVVMYNPVDMILDYLRDFSDILGDIKRKPEYVRDAGISLVNLCLDYIPNITPKDNKYVFIPMHLPQFLNRKDFEKVYLPSFKMIVDSLSSKGLTAMYYFERKYEHLFDYLKELPKGLTVGLFEGDDIRLVKKELGGNMCIAGGMPVSLLKSGTKQQCVDCAKGLIDDVAPGGGYIFTTDMFMLTAADGKGENLKAVNDFVHEYGIYR